MYVCISLYIYICVYIYIHSIPLRSVACAVLHSAALRHGIVHPDVIIIIIIYVWIILVIVEKLLIEFSQILYD